MKRLLWCSLLLLLIACKDSGKASCDNVTRFLEFYAKNYDKIYADEGFDYAPKYRVNFNKVAQLAQRLELETYFTDNFRQTFQERYQKADQQLRFQPQSDGPIDGFEADAFLKTQDVGKFGNLLRNALVERFLKPRCYVGIAQNSSSHLRVLAGHLLQFGTTQKA